MRADAVVQETVLCPRPPPSGGQSYRKPSPRKVLRLRSENLSTPPRTPSAGGDGQNYGFAVRTPPTHRFAPLRATVEGAREPPVSFANGARKYPSPSQPARHAKPSRSHTTSECATPCCPKARTSRRCHRPMRTRQARYRRQERLPDGELCRAPCPGEPDPLRAVFGANTVSEYRAHAQIVTERSAPQLQYAKRYALRGAHNAVEASLRRGCPVVFSTRALA